MKRLSTEFTYLINRLLFGIFVVPGILWAGSSLLNRNSGADELLPVTDYYLQFYGNLDNPVNWLWVAAPLPGLSAGQATREDPVEQAAGNPATCGQQGTG